MPVQVRGQHYYYWNGSQYVLLGAVADIFSIDPALLKQSDAVRPVLERTAGDCSMQQTAGGMSVRIHQPRQQHVRRPFELFPR